MREAPFAIMASGTGTNAQALIDAVDAGHIDARLACVVCDVPGVPVVARARAAGVECLEFDARAFASRDRYEGQLVRELTRRQVAWVVLAGYMRICGPVFLAAFEGRTVNVHPSLLPAFPGRDAIGDALAAGATQTGVTVHLVDEGIDTGPIVAQHAVRIERDDTRATLAARLRPHEHRLLVAATAALVRGELTPATRATTTGGVPCLVH